MPTVGYCSVPDCFYYSGQISLDQLSCSVTNDDIKIGEGKHDDNYIKYRQDLKKVSSAFNLSCFISIFYLLVITYFL